MTFEEYLTAISSLKLGGNKNSPKPHKVCLLLAVIELITEKHISSNKIYFNEQLQICFDKYFKLYGTKNDSNNISLPFTHLVNDGIWHLRFNDQVGSSDDELKKLLNNTSVGQIKRIVSYAYLDPELFDLLKNEEQRSKLVDKVKENIRHSNLRMLLEEVLSSWKEAKDQNFTDHPIAIAIRKDIFQVVKLLIQEKYPDYLVKASAGAGNWASVPWVSILNPKITQTTQGGIYPVYLFKADGTGVYLSLNQGTTIPKQDLGSAAARIKAENIKSEMLSLIPALSEWGTEDIDLSSNTSLGQSYEGPNISAKFYSLERLPENIALEKDLLDLLELYSMIEPSEIETETQIEEPVKVKYLPKPFILLAGISGTGKSRFVRKQAEAHQVSNNFCLVPVRPDWHEPSDLLGYVSHISEKPKYISTKVLGFIIDAWRAVAPNADEAGLGELNLTVPPYWLCLDEMNLAPVEQYFADYLSVLESRKMDDDQYSCEPLLDKSIFELKDIDIADDLKLTGANDSGLLAYFTKHGVAIPPNLIVAGTVNMDETTHGFSRKVIDRALTIDFGEFFPNDFTTIFNGQPANEIFTYSPLIQAKQDDLLGTCDSDGLKSIAFLTQVNSVLKDSPFELAYRALNELLLHVACFKPQDQVALESVWDDFMMTKVLPRIEGDEDKLRVIKAGADANNILDALEVVLKTQLESIWDKNRIDLFRKIDEEIHTVSCRSATKIKWMSERLVSNTFTSFWP